MYIPILNIERFRDHTLQNIIISNIYYYYYKV